MSQIFELIFGQYQDVPQYIIILEIIAVCFGFLSVWFSKQENILVYPTGIISTAIFVYILSIYGLLGDMMINAYYFAMSIYGWYVWTRKIDATQVTPISTMSKSETRTSIFLFIGTLIFVYIIYELFNKWESWTSYVDTLTTAIFFVGMWLMALKKIENWIYWIIGDIISVPLYAYKGLLFTSLQYFIFTIIAIYGYRAWAKKLKRASVK